MSVSGGITFVVTMVVTIRNDDADRVDRLVAVNRQVVPPIGLFRLKYTTRLSMTLSMTVEFLDTFLSAPHRLAATVVSGPLSRMHTRLFASTAVMRGTTMMGTRLVS